MGCDEEYEVDQFIGDWHFVEDNLSVYFSVLEAGDSYTITNTTINGEVADFIEIGAVNRARFIENISVGTSNISVTFFNCRPTHKGDKILIDIVEYKNLSNVITHDNLIAVRN